MKTLLVGIALLALAGPATALSCLRPDAVRLYEQARDSEDLYVAVRGRIDLLETANAPVPDSNAPAITEATLSGVALTTHGFGAEFNREVQISATCGGPWCGSAEAFDGEIIAFLKVDKSLGESDSYTLAAGPCGGSAIAWSKDAERRLLACHRDNTCIVAE